MIMLLASVAFGIIYIGLLYSQRTLTGNINLDGMIGAVLGLYICSHPAAHLVEMLFYRRDKRNQFLSNRSLILWLTFNLLILITGGIVIFVGVTQFIGRIDWS